MDIIKEFKKDFEEKYKINDELVKEYHDARKEYMDVKNKYTNTLNELKGQLSKLSKKAQILTDEKVALEKKLEFAAADKKQRDIEKIINDINKIVGRVKNVEDTLKNNGCEIEEKSRLMGIVSELIIEADRKYTDAFADFETRREEYNIKIRNEIPQILSPLGELIWEFRALKTQIQ